MAAIMEDYALPKGFKTRAEREAIKKRSEDKRKKLEERRQKQEEEKLNREREEEKRLEAKEQQRNRDWAKVEAHLSPLTPADREAVIDEALQLHENVFAKRGALKYRRDPEGHLIYEATYRDIVIQHLNLAAETSA